MLLANHYYSELFNNGIDAPVLDLALAYST